MKFIVTVITKHEVDKPEVQPFEVGCAMAQLRCQANGYPHLPLGKVISREVGEIHPVPPQVGS